MKDSGAISRYIYGRFDKYKRSQETAARHLASNEIKLQKMRDLVSKIESAKPLLGEGKPLVDHSNSLYKPAFYNYQGVDQVVEVTPEELAEYKRKVEAMIEKQAAQKSTLVSHSSISIERVGNI